ncbi:Putative isomerase yddE, PhzC-PhzF family [Fulvivirga imtechensis AK7]|uniref:Putative isomerase yddE, PhzC-PhzF family n=1 Tax=Fulvivirga imtechensis AK7 TaxID=1237149 RepID=L8K1A9_9BACT|nr:PhzF family phenazine biosynthesis protein [Fulvivirga imtechensis]ELR73232.1 Putative isomerase yddE, PhzC-PhzF family [Fulvivirga imtechensis AK7]
MNIKTFIIDAFTDKAFRGNPAGVCLLDNTLPEAIMQDIAGELNLSETAFLMPYPKDETRYSIRYFTPTVEIPFCGHATLASAKLVLEVLHKNEVHFTTAHDLQLFASIVDDNILMKFPLYDTTGYEPGEEFYRALGINNTSQAYFAKELDMLLVEVAGKHTLLNLKPDFNELIKASDQIKEVVVTTKSDDENYDFYSRCFCPWIGINEDPVTGAAHSVLARYWGDRLGKTEMKAYQASKRGGYMHLKITSNDTLEVLSQAHVVLEGLIRI